MSHWLQRGVIAGALVMSAALLSSCVTGEPTSSPTPSASASPSASPTTPPAASAPSPALDITCDDLATASLASVVPGDRTPHDTAISVMNAFPTIALQYSILSLGGLACEWSNGVPQSPTFGTAEGYSGARVFVLPNAASQYEKWAAGYGSGAMSCTDDGIYCGSDELVGTTWVAVRIEGGAAAGAGAFASEVAGVVGSATPVATSWTPESALPATCPEIVDDAAVSAAIGSGVSLRAIPPHGGWSIEAAAEEDFGAVRCSWLLPDADDGPGTMTALPGGAWAWNDARESLTNPSAPSTLDVPGLASGDEVWLRCSSGDTTCTVDLILDQDWIEFTLWPAEWTATPPFDRRAASIALAAEIVAAWP